jgi:alginate O-acetyltransferase complex protein AlgI
MLFNSFNFLLFFPIVTLLYFLIPHQWRWLHLLIASCVFYCAFIPAYILILFFTIVIDYIAGILIEKAPTEKRKRYLIVSIVANVGVLAVFKYYNFFIDNINTLLQQMQVTTHALPLLDIILPIGLSFHTFQAMSYTIEVYRGKQKAEKHFGIYALYVMFYPQLVAGPIERPQNVLHQFYEHHHFNLQRVSKGLRMMLWGFFMKVVIADRLSLYVNAVYNNPDQHNGSSLLLATLFFSIQIYCDFAGYSNIALGSAKVMGFDLMMNFKRPYFARSISEFWSRWHISLSTWFRDYLYIPLGGNKVPVSRWYFNLFFVFLVSGFWHGANWTFIIWGGLNGLYLIFAVVSQAFRTRLNVVTGITKAPFLFKIFQIATTFLLCAFAWIFFRANNATDAFLVIKKIFTEAGPVVSLNRSQFPYSILGIVLLLAAEIREEYYPNRLSLLSNGNSYIRYGTYVVLTLMILMLGVFDGGQFIYFQF